MTIQHVNPNCPGAEFCKPHGEDGGVSVDRKKLDAHVTAQIIAELERLAEQYGEFSDDTTGKRINLKAVALYRIKHRINTLKAKETQL